MVGNVLIRERSVQYAGAFVLFVWFLSFSTQGTFYQFSIYLLPAICIFHKPFRQSAGELILRYKLLLAVLIVPVVLSWLNFMFRQADVAAMVAESETLFRYIWRIFVVAIAGSAIALQLKITSERLKLFLIAAATLQGGYAVFSSWPKIEHFLTDGRFFRLSGMMDSPNDFGVFMAIGAVAALSQLLVEKGIKAITVYAVFTCLFIFTAVLSQSRSAWLGLIVGLVLLIGFSVLACDGSTRRKILFASGGLCFGLFVAFLLLSSDGFRRRVARIAEDPARIFIWRHFLSVWKDNLFLGVFSLHGYEAHWSLKKLIFKNPHSLFLDMAVRIGLVGLLSLLFNYLYCFIRFWRSDNRIFAVSLIGSIIVSSFFGQTLFGKVFSQSVLAVILMFLFIGSRADLPSNQLTERL